MLGGQLRRWRRRAGLSQAGLAERAAPRVAAIAALEQGRRHQPHPHTLRQLATALALDATEEAALLTLVSPAATHPPRAPSPSWAGPMPSNPLIGREAELRALTDLLIASPPARLVTLTGPGGVGKTRLALAAAVELRPHFADGVVVVELASMRDPRLVAPAGSHALGRRESATGSSTDELIDRCGDTGTFVGGLQVNLPAEGGTVYIAVDGGTPTNFETGSINLHWGQSG